MIEAVRPLFPTDSFMNAAQSTRLLCAIALGLTVPLGLASKAYTGWGQAWVEGYLGDVLFEMAWIFFIGCLRPRVSSLKLSLWVFGLTSAVETLQLWQPAWLQAIRATLFGKLFLGSTFVWADFLYYAIGCWLGWAILSAIQTRAGLNVARPSS